MEIAGLQKTSLLDYPDKMCATVFTRNCNLRCPFCHNGSLVLDLGQVPLLSEKDIFSYLEKRKGILDGICISGGEPLMQKDIRDFIKEVRKMGYLIKLDTNGTNPTLLKALCEEDLLDYVAMDIKNSRENYAKSTGILNLDTTMIEESADYLLKGSVPYEFRTTVVEELHTEHDFILIGKWLRGFKKYFLQKFVSTEDVIMPGLHTCSAEKMEKFRQILNEFSTGVELRGT